MAADKRAEKLSMRKQLLEARAEKIEKFNIDLRERFLFLLYLLVINDYGRYQYLEQRHGISARKWQNVCNRAQLPGLEMLSTVLKDFPQYSTWLMTGRVWEITQIDPTVEGYINQTELGRIDPTVEGWEDKYDRAATLYYMNSQKEYTPKAD